MNFIKRLKQKIGTGAFSGLLFAVGLFIIYNLSIVFLMFFGGSPIMFSGQAGLAEGFLFWPLIGYVLEKIFQGSLKKMKTAFTINAEAKNVDGKTSNEYQMAVQEGITQRLEEETKLSNPDEKVHNFTKFLPLNEKGYAFVVSLFLAGFMAFCASVVSHDANLNFTKGVSLSKIFYYINIFGYCIAWFIPGVNFAVAFGEKLFIPLLTFIFWAPIFYRVIRANLLDKFFKSGQVWVSYAFLGAFTLVVTIPLFFYHIPKNQIEECLAHPNFASSTCLTSVFLERELKNAPFGDLANICVSLPNKKVGVLINDLENIPKDASYQEYCFYELADYMDIDAHGPLKEDFRKNFLPKDFVEPKDSLDWEGNNRLRKATQQAICEEFGKRVNRGEGDRCLAHFDSEEAAINLEIQKNLERQQLELNSEKSLESASLSIETALNQEGNGKTLVYRQRTDPQYYAPVAEMVNRAREDLAKRLQVDVGVVEVAHVEEILLSNSDRNTTEKLQPILSQGLEGRVGDISFPEKDTIRMSASTGVPAYFSFRVSGSSPNVMLFGYQFSSKGEGLLTVYANGVPIYSLDERRDASKYKRIIVLPVSSGVQNFSVRLDSFNNTSSIVNIATLSVGNYQDIDLSGSESLGYRVDFKKDKIIYSAYIDPTGFKFIDN